MTKPSDFFIREPFYRYVTYSFKEGIFITLGIFVAVSIFALISVVVSLSIGIRKKDCIVVLTANIMVKTVMVSLYVLLGNLLYIESEFIWIFFIATIIIEGLIYKKVLKYKEKSGMIVSVICNIVPIAIGQLIIVILRFA